MACNWTEADLKAIDEAIATGALTVKYNDRLVTYRSLNEMLQIRQLMRECLGHVKRSSRKFCCGDKGIR